MSDRSFKTGHAYEWTDRDEDVVGSFEAWAPDAHPSIVGVLRLANLDDVAAGRTTMGIYVDVDQAAELAALFSRLASEHDA